MIRDITVPWQPRAPPKRPPAWRIKGAMDTRERFWALVLAGGDGTRLEPLTRLIAGRPILARTDDLGWSDWGRQEAIERTLAALGITPPWRAPLRATA